MPASDIFGIIITLASTGAIIAFLAWIVRTFTEMCDEKPAAKSTGGERCNPRQRASVTQATHSHNQPVIARQERPL